MTVSSNGKGRGIRSAVSKFLFSPTSANLAAAVTDETGTGVLVFGTLPTFGGTGIKLSGSSSGTTTILSGATAGTSSITLPVATDTLVGLATTDTLTNKTLTSPNENYSRLTSPKEVITVSATSATGTINIDVLTQSILYYTTAASGSFTINVRGNSGTTLNSLMSIGDSITVVFLSTNTGTAYYPSSVSIDGTTQTTKWQGGISPVSGNTFSTDSYTITIVKTASTPTYVAFGSQTKYA